MSKNTRNRILLTAVAALLLVAVAVGGTMAWLTAKTDEVVNTFEPVTIGIDLVEHKVTVDTAGVFTQGTEEVKANDVYKMLPGLTMPKDPFVKVDADSVDCYVFIEVVTQATTTDLDADTYLNWEIEANWVEVAGVTGPNGGKVYAYCTGNTADSVMAVVAAGGETPSIIDEITVDPDLKNTQLTAENVAKVKLTFYAYAVQAEQMTATTGANTWTVYLDDADFPTT